jgi:hypothetical protein
LCSSFSSASLPLLERGPPWRCSLLTERSRPSPHKHPHVWYYNRRIPTGTPSICMRNLPRFDKKLGEWYKSSLDCTLFEADEASSLLSPPPSLNWFTNSFGNPSTRFVDSDINCLVPGSTHRQHAFFRPFPFRHLCRTGVRSLRTRVPDLEGRQFGREHDIRPMELSLYVRNSISKLLV